MEDVLDLYAEAYDPCRPVVCFDELPVQLLAEVNEPLPAEPGKPKRRDYEYERKGHCSLFIAFEPLTGQRQVTVRKRRTNADFAQQMRQLVASFPEAEVIRVVLDNLNTHTPAALYQTFPADEARRLTRKLEFHYTPKHGSWLNMAEIEWSVLARQALKGRLPDLAAVQARISPWTAISDAPPLTGASPQLMPALSWLGYIPTNLCGGVVARQSTDRWNSLKLA